MLVEWVDKNTVKIRVEDDYDLLTLFKIINEGDIVFGYDYRTIKVGENKKERVKVWIKIVVENIKFGEYTDSLRINGRILEASEIVSGKYHTFDIKIGSELNIQKKYWNKYEIKELQNSEKKTKKLYIVSIDDSEICFAEIYRNKIKILENIHINIPKDDPNRESVFIEKVSRIIKKVDEYSPKILIIVGPIFYPDLFDKECKRKLNKEIRRLKFNVSHGGRYGIYEFLKRKEYLDAVKEVEIIEVNKKIQEFLNSMLNGLVVLGYEKVIEYLQMKNIEFILISYKFFKKLKEEGKSKDILALLKMVEKSNAEVFFVYEENENYEMIDKFGVVAKIRYKIE